MRKKRIFDITPLDQRGDLKNYNESLYKEINITKKIEKESGFSIAQFISFFIITGIVIIAGLYFVIEPKLDISITPRIIKFEALDRKILAGVESSDSVFYIPLTKLEFNREFNQEIMPSTQDSSKKAKGKIRFYNEYSDGDETFVAGTRFMQEDGMIFLTLGKSVVPGNHYVDVEVIAAQAGEDYNISASTFSIPKLRGTEYFDKFYGKSLSDMTGGAQGAISLLSDDDIDQAKSLLESKVFEEMKNIVQKEYSDYEILNDSIDYDIIYPDYKDKIGEEMEIFNCIAEVEITALGIKKGDLNTFAKNYIKSNISSKKKTLDNTMILEIKSQNVDIYEGNARLSIDLSVDTYFLVDEIRVKESIAGLNKGQIPTFVMDLYADRIQEVSCDLSPFWAQKAPINLNKINIQIQGLD